MPQGFPRKTTAQERAQLFWKRREREISRVVATKSTRLMNNTKWREIIGLWNNRDAFQIQVCLMKFIESDHVFALSYDLAIVHPTACDGIEGPFTFREIDWMEFPEHYDGKNTQDHFARFECRQDVSGIREAIRGLGKLPIEERERGFRIVGYLD